MIELWTSFVGILALGFNYLVQLFGGNIGMAIIAFSSSVRFALLPVSLRLTRRAAIQQAILEKLQPELLRLKERYKSKPERLTRETLRLYRAHGYHPFNSGSFLGILLQLPVFAGLYSVIKNGIGLGSRFLWIADLAKPDVLLIIIIGVLTLATSLVSPNLSHQSKTPTLVLPTIITFVFVWQLSSGLGLYWAASSLFGVVQNIVVYRHKKK